MVLLRLPLPGNNENPLLRDVGDPEPSRGSDSNNPKGEGPLGLPKQRRETVYYGPPDRSLYGGNARLIPLNPKSIAILAKECNLLYKEGKVGWPA